MVGYVLLGMLVCMVIAGLCRIGLSSPAYVVFKVIPARHSRGLRN